MRAAGWQRRMPGLTVLRSWLPPRRSFKADLLAGLPGAISSVPDGMASGVLAGVNPAHGLYASFAGPIAGGATASTRRMAITTTSAAALAAGSTLASLPAADRSSAIVLLTFVAGLAMVAAALLRLGRYTRFVSHSVMSGFLTGVAVNIVLGQLPDLAGVTPRGDLKVTQAWNVLAHPAALHLPSLAVGLGAIALLVVLERTPLALYSSLIALVVPSAVVLVTGAPVARVGRIPQGFPLPQLPDLGVFSLSLVTGGLAVAAIILVQGAGVAESAPNGPGEPADANRDFAAQGFGNLAAALFRGQPVGGSVGQTAINVSAGARSRWGAIWSGIWMLAILVVFPGLVGKVALPTLSAVLVVAGIGSLRPREVLTIWRTGPSSKIALATTLVATLTLPVTAAVGIGVALSLLLQLNQEAMDLRVVRLVPGEDGRLAELAPPARLEPDEVVVLDVYGSLFYAGARTLQAHLPATGAPRAAVILRLRGRTTLGATFFSVIAAYARRLEEAGGQLYLSGLSEEVLAYWHGDRLSGLGVSLELFAATEVLGESTQAAFARAQSRRVHPHS